MAELRWQQTEYGPIPLCANCLQTMLSPQFAEAMWTVALDHGTDPYLLGIQVVERFHTQGHLYSATTTETDNPQTP